MKRTLSVLVLTAAMVLGIHTPAMAYYSATLCVAGPVRLTVSKWLDYSNPQFPVVYHMGQTYARSGSTTWAPISLTFNGYRMRLGDSYARTRFGTVANISSRWLEQQGRADHIIGCTVYHF